MYALVGPQAEEYHLQAALGTLLLRGGAGVEVGSAEAADLLNAASEGAMVAMKGQLSMKYLELAGEAEELAAEECSS